MEGRRGREGDGDESSRCASDVRPPQEHAAGSLSFWFGFDRRIRDECSRRNAPLRDCHRDHPAVLVNRCRMHGMCRWRELFSASAIGHRPACTLSLPFCCLSLLSPPAAALPLLSPFLPPPQHDLSPALLRSLACALPALLASEGARRSARTHQSRCSRRAMGRHDAVHAGARAGGAERHTRRRPHRRGEKCTRHRHKTGTPQHSTEEEQRPRTRVAMGGAHALATALTPAPPGCSFCRCACCSACPLPPGFPSAAPVAIALRVRFPPPAPCLLGCPFCRHYCCCCVACPLPPRSPRWPSLDPVECSRRLAQLQAGRHCA